MTRLIALSSGFLALSVLAVDANAQPATPGPPPVDPADPSDNDATALAKRLQNPIGDPYSFPFQNNTNFNTGPNKGTEDILNVQPVIPIHISEDWNVITRTILPLIWQPSLQPAQIVPFGTGPTTFTTLPEFPFQPGSSLNAAGINYNSIQAMQAMKRLNELESLRPPTD